MENIDYSTAQNQFCKLMEQVCNSETPVIITKGDRSAVMMSLSDYNALQETMYLLDNSENCRRLLNAIDQLEGGNSQ